ncbi:DUF3499 family protein [Corynebacterium choanae]|uniref:DUF3499 domain-containing protein n=1 Tax=Corynebacterium choanae TaxID=1862358 RepID=A0A3G6J4F7_9CORY|nr:DUF3499 family protein [Corynebacterium choanae]AZA12907.1 hypothetical protein CCHOA_02450 [Corynebacterium choanae]
MSRPRICCRPGCAQPAVATLTYSQPKQIATLRQLVSSSNGHSWDLCIDHAAVIRAPIGWTLRDPHGFATPTPPQQRTNAATGAATPGSTLRPGGRKSSLSDPLTELDEISYSQPKAGPVPPPKGPGAPHPAQRPRTRRGTQRGHLYVVEPQPSAAEEPLD